MSEQATRVFLADDHRMFRQALAEIIGRRGEFEVVGQCGNGLEVLERVGRSGTDVVVLDITMPGLNGLDVCRELTRRMPDLAVLILSMHEDEEFVARALRNGACGYLMKEADNEQLIEALETVSRGEVYLGPGISRNVLQRIVQRGVDPYEMLTLREREVLQLIAEGKTNRQVAEALGLAVKTVDTHRTRLMGKLDIHNQTELVKFAIARGIVRVSPLGDD